MKVVLLWVKHILNVLFPLSEDELSLQKTSPALFSEKYNPRTFKGIAALSSFRDKDIRAAIHLNKFHKHKTAAVLLATLLKTHLENLPQGPYVVIPIPLSKARERKRGYNQVTNVLMELKLEKEQFKITTDVLYRTKNTIPQTTLTKEARLKNLTDAFSVAKQKEAHLKDVHVLLIDDVSTTGTTLREAKKALLEFPIKSITCIALCS